MPIPEKIGRYEVKGELGRGGFATVYRAYDPRFEREVAIKFLPLELQHSDPKFRLRFQHEAKIIAQLEHPSIVPVYDVSAEDEQPYFVMRYMGGGSLSERIKEKPYNVEDAVKILEAIAPGLDEAHSKGIVHRDLKPANILFTENNVPLISDFGIAKFTQGDNASDLTGSAIIGTPAYMSPEQASGDPIDGRSDLYAFGVILYEMLVGKQPFTADTPLGLALKHLTEPVPHILDANPNLPSWMEKVISRALAKDPHDRFSSAVEMVETVKACLRGENPLTESVSATQMSKRKNAAPTQPAQPSSRSLSRAWIWSGVAVVIIGAIIVVSLGKVFAAPTAPQTPVEPTAPVIADTAAPTLAATETEAPTSEPSAAPETETPTAESAPTESASSLPVVGGADKIAFVKESDIWTVNVDGSDAQQLTNDGLPKFNLQWLPDGKTVLYMSGKSVKTVNVETEVEDILTTFLSAEYFESFSVSPDGKQVAISLNRELFIAPFDAEKLRAADRKSALLAMGGCFFNKLMIQKAQWSDDGTKLAIQFIANDGGAYADTIRLYDVSNCDNLPNAKIDEFPAIRFKFSKNISSFNWDGDLLFFLTSAIRNGGFGDLAFYNLFTHKAEKAAPYENNCCYRDATFSPDGTQALFAFQDIRLGSQSPINLYIVPADSLSAPRKLTPLLPDDFFAKRDEAPQPVMRPAQ
ncbi:MAG: protein kinase [Anaerolineales bacterium]|nr:protein kinase [Anaerolineales bacterium]